MNATSSCLPRIIITPGEPAGIGPDLCVKIAQQAVPAEVVVVADPQLMEDRAKTLGLNITVESVTLEHPPQQHMPGTLKCLPVKLAKPVCYGQTDIANVPYVLETLRLATTACMDAKASALVTGPIHKGIINEAGISFTGHTEFLAEHTGSTTPVMMLATDGLKVALVTTHLPLSQVAKSITVELLERVIRVLHADLQSHFRLTKPCIMVCGLNPHAGEGGHLGREEVEVIEPTLEKLREQGMQLIGPLPADTLFIPKYLDRADVVLAMYHDQGLPVLKHRGFGRAVNITLGLPIIRTSVDHGTALDLAGTGQADTGSLEYAIQVAIEMAEVTPHISQRRT